MESTQKKASDMTCNVKSKGCYMRKRDVCSQALPEYEKLAVPRTLQGFYAKENGCPCIPKIPGNKADILHTSTDRVTGNKVKPTETYRTYGPGPHKVYPADDVPLESTAIREPATGARLVFPNARNYGGTATQHGFPAIGVPKRKTRAEKEYDRMYDRKEFLKAVLRDEIRDRLSAEEELECYENELGLRGSRHAQRLAEIAKRDIKDIDEDNKIKTVAEQYDEVMEELRYVTKQPVGLKVNIVRLHYLLEEQDRLKYLRENEKKQMSCLTQKVG